MKTLHTAFRLGLLIASAWGLTAPPVVAQGANPQALEPPSPGLRRLAGDDARRARRTGPGHRGRPAGRSLG